MKIFRCDQIKAIDGYTINNEPVTSVDLMERAVNQLLRWFITTFDRSRHIFVFTGPGNNGGDGLALARLLSENRFDVEVINIKLTDKTSPDWKINYQRLLKETDVSFYDLERIEQFPFIAEGDIVVDALFGSGLTRPAEGLAADVIKHLNISDCIVVSVDIPSGLFGEDNKWNDIESVVRADHTLSFQFPKLSFMFAENSRFTGDWKVIPIGLNKTIIEETETPYAFVENDLVLPLLKKRKKFDHKGVYGHGLLVAGSYGKTGAAVLGARSALRAGLGLLSCHIPSSGYQVLQTACPEAIVRADNSERLVSEIGDIDQYDAVGIGPGLGTDEITQKAFHKLLLNRRTPLIIDADGINILGLNKKWLSAIPAGSILTPHVKEFERIAGKAENGFARLEKQLGFAVGFKCTVILKGAFTSIATPQGKIFFNSTGNPGMATAGSGDVLTGILLALLAQGYSPENASLTGVYIHGLAGDIAAEKNGYESLIASDIIDNIGNAFLRIRSSE